MHENNDMTVKFSEEFKLLSNITDLLHQRTNCKFLKAIFSITAKIIKYSQSRITYCACQNNFEKNNNKGHKNVINIIKLRITDKLYYIVNYNSRN